MIEKGKNHFDVLPNGWVKVDHVSGMPLYLHRQSRSVTLSRPYHLGTAAARVSFFHQKIVKLQLLPENFKKILVFESYE